MADDLAGRRQLANVHSDPAYDAKIIDELGDLHEHTEPVLTVSPAPARYRAYSDRLGAAYDRALAGQTDYVTGVRVDSYDAVWHEPHEDLLRVRGAAGRIDVGRCYVPLDGTSCRAGRKSAGRPGAWPGCASSSFRYRPRSSSDERLSCIPGLGSNAAAGGRQALRTGVAYLQEQTGRSFGTGTTPAARLGALRGAGEHARHDRHRSLDLGMNDAVEQALAAEAGRPGTPATRTPGSSRDTRTSC